MSSRPDASMSLLRDMLDNPLDAGYRASAEQRDAGHEAPLSWWQKVLVVVLCAVLAAVAMWSAKELRRPAGERGNARALLTEQIRERNDEGEGLREANAKTSAEIRELREATLGSSDEALVGELALLGAVSGAAPVRGPGVVLTLDDSPDAKAGEPGSELGRVQDVDLQVIVNGLWAAGAEAIAVNDKRLSATSAIRSAGQAILVDLAAVAPPYTVEAVGDPADLQVRLARTNAGQHITALRETYDISVEVAAAEELVLPRAGTARLRFAEPVPQDERPSDAEDGDDVSLPDLDAAVTCAEEGACS